MGLLVTIVNVKQKDTEIQIYLLLFLLIDNYSWCLENIQIWDDGVGDQIEWVLSTRIHMSPLRRLTSELPTIHSFIRSFIHSFISGIIDGCFDLASTCCSLTTNRINSPTLKNMKSSHKIWWFPCSHLLKKPCFFVGLVDGSWPHFLHFLEEQLHGTRMPMLEYRHVNSYSIQMYTV